MSITVSTPSDTSQPTVGDVVATLERMYPPSTAESWDAVGLVCGDPHEPVHKILMAVDPVSDVVDEALDMGADMLIVHHPLLLRAVNSVAADSFKGHIVHRLIRAGCALYIAHTNADSASPGVSDALGRTLGLTNMRPLQPSHDALSKLVVFVPPDDADAVIDAASEAGAGTIGRYRRCAWQTAGQGTFEPLQGASPAIGAPGERATVDEIRVELVVPLRVVTSVIAAVRRAHPYEEPAFDLLQMEPVPGRTGIGRVGELEQEMTLERFAGLVAKVLPHTAQGVRVAGDNSALVRTVAVCGGSGDSLFDQVRASGADAYVTADLRHHPVSEAREQAAGGPPYLVDVAHWASEWPWLNGCASRLDTEFSHRGYALDILVSTQRTDPWTFRVASSGGLVR